MSKIDNAQRIAAEEKRRKYWSKRFTQLEQAQHATAVEDFAEIQKMFDQAQRNIEAKINSWYGRFATNNGISIEDAREMLSASELKELKWDVNDYIKYGEENAMNQQWLKELENASAKAHISRLEAIKLQTQQECEKLTGNLTDNVDDLIKRQYQDSYYHTAYEIQKGTGVGGTFAAVDQATLDKVVHKPWAADGKNFVTRLGENKVTLINNIHNSITQMCLTGDNPKKVIDQLARTMNNDKVRAARIVRTESAYFSEAAQKDSYKELGVEEYEIVATLDQKTDEICADYDGTHHPIKMMEPGVTAPPFHPNCRCCTVPYFNDEFTEDEVRAYRDEDGKTQIGEDMSFKEWKEKYTQTIVPQNKKNEKYSPLKNADKKATVQLDIQFFARIPIEKLSKYALDPTNSSGKAKGFELALGYTQKDAEELRKRILELVDEDKFIHKGHNGYGNIYEYVVRLDGKNGKKANVLTAWIEDPDSKEKRLTSIYITDKDVTK